jgi:hypothetical protein
VACDDLLAGCFCVEPRRWWFGDVE